MGDVRFEWSKQGYAELKNWASTRSMIEGSALRIASAAESGGLADVSVRVLQGRDQGGSSRPYAVVYTGSVDEGNVLLKSREAGRV